MRRKRKEEGDGSGRGERLMAFEIYGYEVHASCLPRRVFA